MNLTVSQTPHVARWWHALPDGRVECDVCPRACKLRPGQRGFCFARQNLGGQMVLPTYGRSSGFCIDPIEKKPLAHFHPGTSVLSFGTAGCNLGCRFCQNWAISKAKEFTRLADVASPDAIAAVARRFGCRSVAFTYNDPVIFAEYAMDVADACRALGVATVAVTAGYMKSGSRMDFYRHIDAANVDLKGFTDAFYRRECLGHLQPVLDTLVYLHQETPVWLEVTTLIIPGQNDSDGELHAAADWFVENLGLDVPWHFTAFHPDYKMRHIPPTPPATLCRARAIAMSRGLRYVFTGNVSDVLGNSSWCPGCGRCVIGRAGYDLQTWELQGGRCVHCGFKIAGHFDALPGAWGGRRLPVRLDRH